MREIRLRAIPVSKFDAVVGQDCNHGDGTFIYGWGAQENPNGTALFMRDDNDGVIVKADTVGQDTGMCDKNGVKIWVDDIVCYNAKPKMIGIVKFGNYGEDRTCYHTGFYIDWIENDCFLFLRNDIRFWVNGGKIKVIGNIHNNSELLGSTDE